MRYFISTLNCTRVVSQTIGIRGKNSGLTRRPAARELCTKRILRVPEGCAVTLLAYPDESDRQNDRPSSVSVSVSLTVAAAAAVAATTAAVRLARVGVARGRCW